MDPIKALVEFGETFSDSEPEVASMIALEVGIVLALTHPQEAFDLLSRYRASLAAESTTAQMEGSMHEVGQAVILLRQAVQAAAKDKMN